MMALAIDPDDLQRILLIARIIQTCEKCGTTLTVVHPKSLADMIAYVNTFCTPEVTDENGLIGVINKWMEGYALMHGVPDAEPPSQNAFGVDTVQ